MYAAGFKRQTGHIKLSFMCGVHDGAVGICDADRACGWSLVDDGGGDGTEMGGATTVGDSKRIGRKDSRGGPTRTVDKLKSVLLETLGGGIVVAIVFTVGSFRCQLLDEAANCRGRPEEIVLFPPFMRKAMASSWCPTALCKDVRCDCDAC